MMSRPAIKQLLICFLGGLVILKALSYWMISFIQHPGEPLSSTIIYRIGDGVYYPLISSASRLEFGETMIYEHRGQGIRSAPFIATAFHAACFRIFQEWGFLFADIVIALVVFFLFWKFFERLGLTFMTGGVGALAIVCSMPGTIMMWLLPSLAIKTPLTIPPWGWRMPRPFISEIFLILCLCMTIDAFLNPAIRPKKRTWMILGASLGLFIQCDPFYAVTICYALIVLVFIRLWKNFLEWKDEIAFLGICAASALAALIPMIWQRAHEIPDIAARFGLFPIDRKQPLFLSISQFHLPDISWDLVLYFCMAAIMIVLTRAGDPKLKEKRSKGIILLALLTMSAFFTLPLSSIVFGKGVQIWHYRENFYRLFLLCIWTWFFLGVDIMAHRLRPAFGSWPRALQQISLFAFYVLLFISWAGLTFIGANCTSRRTGHMRSDYPEWSQLPNYRSDYSDLIHELQKPDYRRDLVLATLDWQVSAWWLTFRHGYVFNADPFLTTVPDDEIETRLIILCKILGLTSDQFIELIQIKYVNIFWLGASKYQASQAYRFAPLDDYTPEQKKLILDSPVTDSFNIVMPISEKRRLLFAFDVTQADLSHRRLDLIIITKDAGRMSFRPSADRFVLKFENPMFQLWQIKKK